MKEAIDLIEACATEGLFNTKTGLRRDILMIFNSWHNEPTTAEKIKEILEAKSQSVEIDAIYDNLDALVKNNILIKKVSPSKGERGRPPFFFELNQNAVYDQFKLLEDLLDASGFDPISCDESGNAYVEKFVCMVPNDDLLLTGYEKIRSARNAFDGGQLGVVVRPAESEDFEKTWRLEQFIKKLEERCKTDSHSYKTFREDREYQELVKVFKRHGMRIPAKEEIIHKTLTIHGTGPLICHIDKTNKPEDEQEASRVGKTQISPP